MLKQPVVDVQEDTILKLGLLRDEARDLRSEGCMIEDVGRKKRYLFTSTFDADAPPEKPAEEVSEFLAARIRAGVDSCLIAAGLSGSGKSTHIAAVIAGLAQRGGLAGARYSLSESYCQQTSVYLPPRAVGPQRSPTGLRKAVKDFAEAESEPYRFTCHPRDLATVVESFSRRCPTRNNQASSRAHQVLVIHHESPACTTRIVDMAGSERTQAVDKEDPMRRQRLKESNAINLDFSQLARLLAAPVRKKFRSSGSQIVKLIRSVGSIALSVLLRDSADCTAGLWLRSLAGLF